MSITRYELQTDENGSQTLVEAKHGEFVEYVDHVADRDAVLNGALTAASNAEAEVERLREALAKSSVTVELKAPDIESIVSDLLPQALRDVASERRRQVEEEGYSHAHDYEPTDDELMNCFDVIRDLKQSNAAKDAEIERLRDALATIHRETTDVDSKRVASAALGGSK